MKQFLAVFNARNLEFLRDTSALSWNILLPVLLVLAFAFMFSNDNRTIYKVAIFGESNSAQSDSLPFMQTQHIEFINTDTLADAIKKVDTHQLDMAIDFTPPRKYWVNSTSSSGYLTERILWGTGGSTFQKETVDGQEVRYVDWVLPGILAMNMMFSCLFGVGYVIVRYRKNGFLKRLKATPLSPMKFLMAQMLSRLLLIQTLTILIYIGCDFFIDFKMLGSYLNLLIISIIGAISLISLGLLVAARLSSEELAGGLLNLISWPMMLLSGVWFSLEGTQEWVKMIAQILPLTHLVDGARAIMTEGASLIDIAYQLSILSLMSLVFLLIGARIFRWE